jgi:hypothetical protein
MPASGIHRSTTIALPQPGPSDGVAGSRGFRSAPHDWLAQGQHDGGGSPWKQVDSQPRPGDQSPIQEVFGPGSTRPCSEFGSDAARAAALLNHVKAHNIVGRGSTDEQSATRAEMAAKSSPDDQKHRPLVSLQLPHITRTARDCRRNPVRGGYVAMAVAATTMATAGLLFSSAAAVIGVQVAISLIPPASDRRHDPEGPRELF